MIHILLSRSLVKENSLNQELPLGKHVHEKNTPLNPLLCIKSGFAGLYLFFLFLLKNIDCGYSARRF